MPAFYFSGRDRGTESELECALPAGECLLGIPLIVERELKLGSARDPLQRALRFEEPKQGVL
jgi:hypothetical protein